MSEPLNFDPSYFSKGEVKVLTVNGDSMLGDSICDGDLALITPQKNARKNDIVAVRVEAEGITLKRLEKKGEMITLIPSNPRFKKKTFSSSEVSVLGKFVNKSFVPKSSVKRFIWFFGDGSVDSTNWAIGNDTLKHWYKTQSQPFLHLALHSVSPHPKAENLISDHSLRV